MSLDELADRTPSRPVFWLTVVFLVGLSLLLVYAQGSLNSLMAALLGAAAASCYGIGASDAVVGLSLGLISVCSFLMITGLAVAVGHLLFTRRFPNSKIGNGLTALLVVAAAGLVGESALDQVLAGAAARIAHVTEPVVLIAVFGTVMAVTWRHDKVLRPEAATTAPAWDPFDVQDDYES